MTEKDDASSQSPVTITKVSAKYVSYAHTAFAYAAFLLALIVGCYTHYYKIVENEYFGYPQEWFPSVSAATGDRYPARAIFQIFIALTSGPRFALVFLWYLYTTRSARSASPGGGQFLLIVGLVRTVACGGWVYITSTDDHLTHDIAMILYLVCTLPWQLGCLRTTPSANVTSYKRRRLLTLAFFVTLPFMIYYFLQHKVDRVPGAYTIYAFFEWSLILYDVAFDAITALDFKDYEFAILDRSGTTVLPAPLKGLAPDNRQSLLTRVMPLVGFAAETYMAFVFWTLLTALALLIWYFPLWYMGISGFEAFLFITLAPIVLCVASLRHLMAKYRGVFHLISLVGIASYLKQDPVWRLSLTAAGLAISLTTWMASWIENRSQSGALDRSILIWALGLLTHNVVKLNWWTENPIWPIMHRANGGQNELGIFLGIVSAIIIMRSRTPQTQAPASTTSPSSLSSHGNWYMAACGFGSLLFALHSMYTDSSTIMRWTVDGYPNYGPDPATWGWATVTALGLGVFVSSRHRSLTTSMGWYVVGSVACAVFYATRGWPAYVGGLVLGMYLTSIAPSLIRAMVAHSPFKTLFTTFMVYNVLCLAHVWVVAYEFVPGGVYARERTNWVLGTVMFLLALGVYNARLDRSEKLVQRQVLIETRYGAYAILATLFIASIFISAKRSLFAATPMPYTTSEKSFTAGIWTIHFALDNDMWASEIRMRDAIRDLELDVIGLLESDTQRIIMGNRDWAQYIAEDLGYYLDYGPPTMDHTWGCLMLSKFPIINSTHHLLPSPVGELACAIHATLDVYGQPVDFIVSHNGQEENPEDRRQQTTELARIMRTSSNPFVFLGYVVTKPQQPLYHLLFDGGDMNDIDESDWDRWCEYVGYRGLRRVGYARVSHGKITDTEIQTGKFQVVDDPQQYWKATYDRIDESQVTPSLRYPSMFRGQGVRGHRYHVFDEPRYFVR